MLSQLVVSPEKEPIAGSTIAEPEWEEEILMCGNKGRRHPRDQQQQEAASPSTFFHSTLQPCSEQLRPTRIFPAVTSVLFSVCYLESPAHPTLSFSAWEVPPSTALGCLNLFFLCASKALGEAKHSYNAVCCHLIRTGAP